MFLLVFPCFFRWRKQLIALAVLNLLLKLIKLKQFITIQISIFRHLEKIVVIYTPATDVRFSSIGNDLYKGVSE